MTNSLVDRLRNEQVEQSSRCGEEDSQDRALLAEEAANEIERLRKLMDGKTFVTDNEGAIDQLHAAVKTAQELAATRLMEVESLREALEKISLSSCDASETHYNCYLMESVTDAARAALNPETPK